MQRYYYGLDGLRFFSAIAVCVFHLAFYVWASEYAVMSQVFADRAKFQAMVPFAWSGWIGVQIFFVISGFVIAHSSIRATPMSFIRSRMLRLLPAAWVCATITLAIRLASSESLPDLDGSYLRSITLWPKGPWIDGVYWSLAVEVMFYTTVFALLLSRSIKLLPQLAWTLALASAAFVLLEVLRRADLAATGDWFRFVEAQSEFLPLRHGVFFALGIWLWMFANRSLPRSGWIGIAIAVVFGLAEIGVRGSDVEGQETAAAAAGQPLVAPMLIWLLAVATLTACTRWPDYFLPRSHSGGGLLKLAGKATYPLYLVHGILGATVMGWLLDLRIPPYVALVAGVSFVLSVAIVVALFAEPLVREPLRMALDATERAAARIKGLGFLVRRSEGGPDMSPARNNAP